MKERVTIIGHFAKDVPLLYDGQTIKTRIVGDELEKGGEFEITTIDTRGWKKHPARLFGAVRKAAKTADHIMMMPDYKGFHVFSRILPFFTKNTKCTISYSVIGGWLVDFIKTHPNYVKYCNKFDAIFPESDSMIEGLTASGVKNLHKIVNFKRLSVLETPVSVTGEPKRFCTFSRILKSKGIEDAANCIRKINEEAGRVVATLDMYGDVDAGYAEDFEKLKADFPEYITYKGTIPFTKSVETLTGYYALLFPTTFYGEGVPGTVIDAFASGLPVLAYDWPSAREIITDKSDGFITEPKTENLVKLVKYALDNEEVINGMRENCLKKAKAFTPEENVKELVRIIKSLKK